MRPTRFSPAVLALMVYGCGTDATQPGKPNPKPTLTAIVIDFCSNSVPAFFAYRNDGEAWIRATPDANGSFTFMATDKVSITFASGNQSETYYTTTQDLQSVSGVACRNSGAKTISGAFANLGAEGSAVVAAGRSRTAASGPFTLAAVPDGTTDLVAMNYRGEFVPTKAIIRRDLQPASGSSIPVFDFLSPEAATLVTNTLTVSGLASSFEFNNLFIAFTSANGTFQNWEHGIAYTGATRAFRSVPSSLLLDGDLHTLSFTARADNFTSHRSAILHYRQPSDKSIALGPKLNPAAFTVLTSAPYLRVRGSLQSQPEYANAVKYYFSQLASSETGGQRDWTITGTARYFGGSAPATWEMEIPDLSPVAGFPALAGFEASQQTTAMAEGLSDVVGLRIGRAPRDGDFVRYAASPATTIPSQ